jgi:hypothetical protein
MAPIRLSIVHAVTGTIRSGARIVPASGYPAPVESKGFLRGVLGAGLVEGDRFDRAGGFRQCRMIGKNRHYVEASLRGIAAKVSVNMLNHNDGPAGVWAY